MSNALVTFREIFKQNNCEDLWRERYAGCRCYDLARELQQHYQKDRLQGVIHDLYNYGLIVPREP